MSFFIFKTTPSLTLSSNDGGTESQRTLRTTKTLNQDIIVFLNFFLREGEGALGKLN